MSSDVDLRQLAIPRSRSAGTAVRPRRHVLTRYVLPAVLCIGFLSLVGWAAWDTVFPPRRVTVVPVYATHAKVQREGTPLFKAAGWIEPRPTPVRVAALAPGVVEALLVVEDQPVEAGQVVAELVQDDARLAHRRATANLKLRQAEAEEARAALRAATVRFERPVHLEAALADAEAALAKVATELANLPFATRRAEAELEYAHANYEGKLAARGTVSDRVIEAARSELEADRALVDELRDRARSLEREREALSRRRDALTEQLELLADERQAKEEAAARLEAAEARVEQVQVAVAEAELRLDRMTVRAPIDGRVYQLVAEPGTTLTGGMGADSFDGSTVVTLYRPESLQVRVDVRFEDIPKVMLGQPVEIDNPALSAPLSGSVLFVSSEADIQKNTLEVKVELPSPPEVFKPDMLVDVTFLAPPQKDAGSEASEEMRLYVPERLIQTDERGAYVWLADQSTSVARRTPVQTGGVTGQGLVEVADGLSVSSRVIADSDGPLEDGARIEVIGEEGAELEELSVAAGAPRGQARLRRAMNRLPTGEGH